MALIYQLLLMKSRTDNIQITQFWQLWLSLRWFSPVVSFHKLTYTALLVRAQSERQKSHVFQQGEFNKMNWLNIY